MDFQQYYPTPPELAERLVKLISNGEGFKNQEFYLPTNQNSLLMLTEG